MFGFGGRAQADSGRGADIAYKVTLTFEEAAFGKTLDVRLNRTERCKSCAGTGAKNGKEFSSCEQCKGTGKMQYVQDGMFGRNITVRACNKCSGTGKIIKEKCGYCAGRGQERKENSIKVEIPAGIDSGQFLVQGEGEQGARSNGDLILNIVVMRHKHFTRKGQDLYLEVPVPFTQAILGARVKIPAVKGYLELEIPEYTQPGTQLRLKGKGLKYPNRNHYGDIIVTVLAECPKKLNSAQKDILKRFVREEEDSQYERVREFKKNV
jgi:molecular chaperone DnaJ